MKNPFKTTPPPKKKFRKSALPDTLDKALERELIKRARRDPEWAFAAAKHKFGLMLPEETEDPLEKLEKETLADLYSSDPEFRERVKSNYLKNSSNLQERLEELAIQEIENNPELTKKAIRSRVDEMLGNGDPSDPVFGMLTTLRSYKALQEEFGGDNSRKEESLFGPETIIKVLDILPQLLNRQGGSSPRTYVVETPSGILEMDAEGYKKYLEGRQLTALQEPTQGQLPAPQDTPPVPPQQKISLHISSWLAYLDRPPQDFVEDLRTSAEQDGNLEAQVTLAFLQVRTAEQVIAFLEENVDHPELGEAVRSLLSHPDWIRDVVKMIQEVA